MEHATSPYDDVVLIKSEIHDFEVKCVLVHSRSSTNIPFIDALLLVVEKATKDTRKLDFPISDL